MSVANNERKIKMIMDLVDIIDESVTSYDIVNALQQVERQRERKRRTYQPTGKPKGRPRKETMIFTGDN